MKLFAQADGLLGVAELMHFTATIDPAEKVLVLRPRGAPYTESGTEIPMEVSDGRILVRGKLNKREMLWWIHTGFLTAPLTASLDAYEEAGVGVSTARAAADQGKRKVTIVLVQTASAGDFKKQMQVGLAGAFPDGLDPRIEGILCSPFFGSAALTFDFDRSVLIVRP
jgi:hypothetical protein